jgi:hypothetical protein
MLGTDEQYSFACDFDRYAIHLEKGRARFENRFVGIYRNTGYGMYTGLNELDKSFWEARAKLDHWRYFGYRHPEFFLGEALSWSGRCLDIMRKVAEGRPAPESLGPVRASEGNADIPVSAQHVADVRRVVDECRSYLAALPSDDPA